MKRSIGLIIVIAIITAISGCMTTTYNERVKYITGTDSPDNSKAYFYGKFTNEDIPIIDRAVIFWNRETKAKLTFQLLKSDKFVLLPVEPGKYHNTFVLYSWDIFYWYGAGKYNVSSRLEKDFTVVPGKIYYVGSFTSKRFTYNFKEDTKAFYEKYPNFKSVSLIKAYNLK